MKKIIVISLGGSLIVPEKMNYEFLKNFRKTLRKFYRTHKFIVVCGGGTIARKYISILEKSRKPENELSLAGIRATRMNALFMIQFFGKESNDNLPANMKEVKDYLLKNNVVICGALRYEKKSTSDTTAAKIANFLKTDFINITNVSGLFNENPQKNSKAKLISKISWREFDKKASKLKYKAGEHFVLDQQAAKIIKKHKIRTHIIGTELSNLTKILRRKKFKGTLIEG